MTVIDLSGGDEHIREIAEESGVEWEIEISSEVTEVIDGFEVETFYDESCESPWHAWKAFAKGFRMYSGASREEAIERLFEKINKKKIA